jgi:hypothetical protein
VCRSGRILLRGQPRSCSKLWINNRGSDGPTQAIPQRIYISTMESFVYPDEDRENPLNRASSTTAWPSESAGCGGERHLSLSAGSAAVGGNRPRRLPDLRRRVCSSMATVDVAVSSDLSPDHAWALASDLRRFYDWLTIFGGCDDPSHVEVGTCVGVQTGLAPLTPFVVHGTRFVARLDGFDGARPWPR